MTDPVRLPPLALRGAAVLGAVALACVLAFDPHFSPPQKHGIDKLAHAAAFAVPSLAAVALAGRLRSAAFWCLGLASCGLVLEAVQRFVPGRSASLRDAAANLAGVALGVIAGALLRRLAASRLRVRL